MPLLLPWMNVTSSASDSSSEVKRYLSSLNRGADDHELEVGDAEEAYGVSKVDVVLEVTSVLWPPFSQLKQLLVTELSGASGLAFVAVDPGLCCLVYSALCLRFFLRWCLS